MDEKLISAIVEEVINQLVKTGRVVLPNGTDNISRESAAAENKRPYLVDDPQDPDALERMLKRTTARIGVGKAGPRLKTQTLLALRADHAQARDAVMKDVDPKILEEAGETLDELEVISGTSKGGRTFITCGL